MPDDDALLLDMLIAARDARRFCAGLTFDDFHDDALRQYAVRLALQIIGEAATRVSTETRTALAGVPWALMAGLRHRLVHDYRRINLSRLWQIVQDDLPPLVVLLEAKVPPDPSE